MIGVASVVASVEALQVDERHAAVTAHADREVDIAHGVHGRGQEWDLQPMPADLDRQVNLGRVQRDAPGTSATSSKP